MKIYKNNYFENSQIFCNTPSTAGDLDFIHYFCLVVSVYQNYLEVVAVGPLDRKSFRHFYHRRVMYLSNGSVVGSLLSFHKRRLIVCSYEYKDPSLKVGSSLFIYNKYYRRELDVDGAPVPYNYMKNLDINIYEKDDLFLSMFSK